jgi:threonine dehydrogenase-like Zn-dependent dehydrogenase
MESRLKEAIDFGADATINGSSDDWKERIFDYFGSNGVDHVVTAAPSLTAVENSIKIVKNGGRILIFGGLPHGNILKVDPNILHYNEITITGSIDSTIDDFKRAALMAAFLDLERFVTHSFALDNVKAGMDVMKKKEGLKIILDITKNN